jgi:hypothetical protein
MFISRHIFLLVFIEEKQIFWCHYKLVEKEPPSTQFRTSISIGFLTTRTKISPFSRPWFPNNAAPANDFLPEQKIKGRRPNNR